MVQIWETWWHLLLNILVAINSVVHNPGVAIIAFTLIIKLATVPLTMKSLRSTRNMQQIQPLIKEIQKKYGKDKAKQQEETMKIYQQYGVNPAAGCFPMLVQLPVFFALYSALQFTLQHGTESAVLSGILLNRDWVQWANFSQPFLWVHNLAKPDDLLKLGTFTIGLWPLLSGLFQLIQSRMSIPIRDPNQPLDSQTKMMQNMMQFMPIYIVLISINFPTGTVVYWAMSNIFGAVQQYFITGFGSLPTIPGFHWLPRKPPPSIAPPPPPPVLADGAVPKKGLMMRMMGKALEAQEIQKSSLEQTQTEEPERVSVAKSNGKVAAPSKGKGKESEPHVKVVSTTTMKYASDLKYRKPEMGNGAHHEEMTSAIPTALPRKKRGKR